MADWVRWGRRSSVTTVTLVTRQGCHACELAEELVPKEARRAGAAYERRDVDLSEADVEAYGHKVPVVLLDGVEHGYWQIDAGRLRAALRRTA